MPSWELAYMLLATTNDLRPSNEVVKTWLFSTISCAGFDLGGQGRQQTDNVAHAFLIIVSKIGRNADGLPF